MSETPFYNTNSWSQTFGLEPHYPCCTVNHPQGWPKFLSASWARFGSNGVAHVLLSPSTVTARVGDAEVTIQCTTAYPFLGKLSYSITASNPFTLYLRVPDWAGSGSGIRVNGIATSLKPDRHTRLHKLNIRVGTTTVAYSLTSTIRTTPRANDTIAVYRGALLYALLIPSTNSSTPPRPFNSPNTHFKDGYAPPQVRDWTLHNASAWNYAIDPRTLVYHGPGTGEGDGETASYQLNNPVFAPNAAPGYMEVEGCQIDWPMHLGSVPGPPPVGAARRCVAGVETLRLVPYGCAKLHMAELPAIDLMMR